MTVPTNYNPADTGCTFPGCASQQTDSLSHLGRRCTEHPPVFDPARAVELVRDGWPDTAMAYIRAAS
jgi:hypothetical protein